MGIDVNMRSPGRPRNERIESRVLEVVRALVIRQGYPSVTMAEIATTAGVAKQTLYRRWPSKAEVVLEAFLDSAAQADEIVYDGLAPTLTRFLIKLFGHLERDGEAIRSLIASAQADSKFLQQFRERFVKPREEALAAILSEAVATQELQADLDTGTLSDMIHGAFWYRLLLGEPLDRSYAERLSAIIVSGRIRAKHAVAPRT